MENLIIVASQFQTRKFKNTNYVRKSSMPDFWFSIHKKKFVEYHKKTGGHFNFIIHKTDNQTNFYSIPANILEKILGFHKEYLHGAWEFTIKEHTLSLHGNGKFDISEYYQNFKNIPHLWDDPIFQELYSPSESTKEDVNIENLIFNTDYDDLSKTEGGENVRIINNFERNAKLRQIAFDIHGYSCAVCGFNFGKQYNGWGKDFAEIHHVIPFSDSRGIRKTNPQTDLVVLCANCHRMIHRKRGITLTVGELHKKMQTNRKTG